jgi:O-antigen ligase
MGLTLVSIPFVSADPMTTFYHFYDRVIIPMCLYLIVRLLAPTQEELRRLLPALFFLCLTQAIFGVIYVTARDLLPAPWLRESGQRATGSLLSPGVYSTTLTFAAMLLLHAALSLKSKNINKFKPLLIGVFILAMLAVFFTFSRASWIVGVFVIAGFLYMYPKFMFRIALVATPVVLLLAGGLLVAQLSYASNRLYSAGSEQSALSRLPVVLASIRMFEAKPVLGWGYGNFDNFDRQFQERVGDLVAPDKDHASHNLYLTILAEQGLIGLLLYLVPAIGLLLLSIKKWSYLPSQGFWGKKLLLIFWLAILSHVVVNNFSNMRVVFGLGIWWMALAFIATILSGANQPAKDEPLAAWSGAYSD